MRVRVDDVRLFFDVEGLKLVPEGPWLRERPTIVLLHPGPGFDHATYKITVGPALARDAQVVYTDLRGHGRSDRSPSEKLRLDTWADDVKGLCDVLGIERPIVLGQGFGSMIAARYASRHPGHAAAFVLAAPMARVVPARSVAVFDRLGGAEVGEAARAFWAEPTERTFADYVRLCAPLAVTYDLTAELFARAQWDLGTLIDWTVSEGATVDTRPDLAGVRVPVLAVAGEDDPQAPVTGAEEVVAALPPEVVQFHRYAGARHSLFRDAPAALDAVRAFIRRVESEEQAP